MLTRGGHGESKKLLEPKGIRVSVLREEKYHPDTEELLGTGYDDHAAAVTSTAGHRLGFQTEIGHRLGNSFVQRADLVVRAPAASVPVLLLEIDRRTENARDLVQKLPQGADKRTIDLAPFPAGRDRDRRPREAAVAQGLPPTGREGVAPVAFVFVDTTEAKAANTVKVLEEMGRRYWAPRRYDTYHRGITSRDYGQAAPVVVATLEQLQEHGADAAVWRRLGRTSEQPLTAALDNPDGTPSTATRPPAPTPRRHSAVPTSGRRSAPCAGGAGRSSPTSAGRRPPRAAEPGRPET
ncbi:hypothetical protein ACFVGY_14675 [Streptomyces sp. NPDC127106]|uniref:hypothetical protein n=1 Tax=Streptomyces sp. NPDC127106 TaxID=3345360 RepID=UPI003635F15F